MLRATVLTKRLLRCAYISSKRRAYRYVSAQAMQIYHRPICNGRPATHIRVRACTIHRFEDNAHLIAQALLCLQTLCESDLLYTVNAFVCENVKYVLYDYIGLPDWINCVFKQKTINSCI